MQTSHPGNRDQYQADFQDKISLKIKSALSITSINNSSHARLPKGHEHFGEICTQNCYQENISACCSREGIITFFADVVINVLVSQKNEVEVLLKVLQRPNNDYKCIYLGENGCLWRVKPIVCEMFLCEPAKKKVFIEKPYVHAQQPRDVTCKKEGRVQGLGAR